MLQILLETDTEKSESMQNQNFRPRKRWDSSDFEKFCMIKGR